MKNVVRIAALLNLMIMGIYTSVLPLDAVFDNAQSFGEGAESLQSGEGGSSQKHVARTSIAGDVHSVNEPGAPMVDNQSASVEIAVDMPHPDALSSQAAQNAGGAQDEESHGGHFLASAGDNVSLVLPNVDGIGVDPHRTPAIPALVSESRLANSLFQWILQGKVNTLVAVTSTGLVLWGFYKSWKTEFVKKHREQVVARALVAGVTFKVIIARAGSTLLLQ